jgi:exosortase
VNKSLQSRLLPASSNAVCFGALLVSAAVVFFSPLYTLLSSSLRVDQYSPVLFVVPISVTLLYLEKKQVFGNTRYWTPGLVTGLTSAGVFLYVAGHSGALDRSELISLSLLLFVFTALAVFSFCFGLSAFRAGLFPLIFLVLMVPLPDKMLAATIALLQNGSVEATCLFFKAFHIPYLRDGVILTLPKVTIEVAKECSGIRSSLILFMADLVLAFLFLKSHLARLVQVVSVLPITIAKNGLRIFALSMLGMYVDPSFLHGNLHRYGGILFFVIGFAALFAEIWLLQRAENRLMHQDQKLASAGTMAARGGA